MYIYISIKHNLKRKIKLSKKAKKAFAFFRKEKWENKATLCSSFSLRDGKSPKDFVFCPSFPPL